MGHRTTTGGCRVNLIRGQIDRLTREKMKATELAPCIVVIIPCFNEEPHIARVISSVPPSVRTIVVVDDASTDGTRGVLERLRDARLVLVAHDRNQGVGAAVISVAVGLVIGLVSGFFRWIDAVMMRVMDGLMAIPSILLAIAVVSLSGASLTTVLVAITIPEIPRVARLVRSVVLSAREEPYVEAAISVGSSLPKIMWRHLMPNTIAPLIVQGTYVCASAILTEAILSFLGTGINPETPTWGNIMAEGRAYFQIKPSLIFWPGLLLSIAILSINLIGDAARDALDPKMKQREGSK